MHLKYPIQFKSNLKPGNININQTASYQNIKVRLCQTKPTVLKLDSLANIKKGQKEDQAG